MPKEINYGKLAQNLANEAALQKRQQEEELQHKKDFLRKEQLQTFEEVATYALDFKGLVLKDNATINIHKDVNIFTVHILAEMGYAQSALYNIYVNNDGEGILIELTSPINLQLFSKVNIDSKLVLRNYHEILEQVAKNLAPLIKPKLPHSR